MARPVKRSIRPALMPDALGLTFVFFGALLFVFALVGCSSWNLRQVYFAKITDTSMDSQGYATFGMLGYCLYRNDKQPFCQENWQLVNYPFEPGVVLNNTNGLPNVYKNSTNPDPTIFPNAQPNPPHDPRFVALTCIICFCAFIAGITTIARQIPSFRYTDKYYTRGFAAFFAFGSSILYFGLTGILYINGVQEYNVQYPNQNAELGAGGFLLQGLAIGSLFLSAFFLLKGCLQKNYEPNHLDLAHI